MCIIWKLVGASSNGRTRDFDSLYLGSNPGAPTKKIKLPLVAILFFYSIFWSHRLMVRTPDSHSDNTGSIPVGTAK